MQKEYDTLFHTDSIILTKGIDFSSIYYRPYPVHTLIQIVYMGNVIYDRISTIEMIRKAIDEINTIEKKIVLNIYTKNRIES